MELGTGTATSTRITLNTIHETLSSFSDITNGINALCFRIYADAAVVENDNPEKEDTSNITLSDLMDRFANYIPLYCDTVLNFKRRFESEFFNLNVKDTAVNDDKIATEPSKLDRCFDAINRLHHTRSEFEDFIASVRGNDVAVDDAVNMNQLENNIFAFLGNCNEILIYHKECMQKMLCHMSETLLLEAS